MDKMMGTLFRLLCRHLRTIWLPRAQVQPEPKHCPDTDAYHFIRSRIPTITNFSTAKYESVEEEYDEADGVRAHGYAGGGASQEEEEGDEVVATSKYCAKAIEDDEEDDEEADEEEDEGRRTGWERTHEATAII
ncbi:hypothetical protein BGY98DRAFT_1103077 [Russula aff. rugulosa BPL654]|nr:hypothetical protein BGY98DRAFT_1103077 [Russula aff. rugulosa BPL654]